MLIMNNMQNHRIRENSRVFIRIWKKKSWKGVEQHYFNGY